jgi:hypothetical protein
MLTSLTRRWREGTSARAASASVPSDALTAATSRIDQRISRFNRIGMSSS